MGTLSTFEQTAKHLQEKFDLIDFEWAGYEVCRQKDLFFDHTAIAVGLHRTTGEIAVVHNHKDTGVALVFITVYANNQKVFYTNSLPDDRFACIARAFSLVEQSHGYSVFDNCQHFSSYCLTGNAKSKGFDNATDVFLWGGLLLAAVGGLSKNPKMVKAGLTSAGISGGAKIVHHFVQEKKKTEREVKFFQTINTVHVELHTSKFQYRSSNQR